MIKRKVSRSRKGDYTFTLSGLTKQHLQLLYSIFTFMSLHRCQGLSAISLSSKCSSLPYECIETLIPLDYDIVHGSPTGLGITQHQALRELLSVFPLSVHTIPFQEYIYHLKTFNRL